MKLVDSEETIVIVVASDLEPDHPDLHNAARIREAIDARGGGAAYRRALVVTDEAWFSTELFHHAPVIAVGGPGVNGVSARLASELPAVWTDANRVVIQAGPRDGPRQATLWGTDRHATGEAVDTFLERGWLDEFLNRCWRFPSDHLG